MRDRLPVPHLEPDQVGTKTLGWYFDQRAPGAGLGIVFQCICGDDAGFTAHSIDIYGDVDPLMRCAGCGLEAALELTDWPFKWAKPSGRARVYL